MPHNAAGCVTLPIRPSHFGMSGAAADAWAAPVQPRGGGGALGIWRGGGAGCGTGTGAWPGAADGMPPGTWPAVDGVA